MLHTDRLYYRINLLLAIPLVLLTTGYWSVIHETIHYSFHPNQKINNTFGRLLCLLFPAPWQVLRMGHIVHHAFNRSRYDQSEVFSNKENRLAAHLRYNFHLLIGLYLSELFSLLLTLAPRKVLVRFIDRKIGNDPASERALDVWIISVCASFYRKLYKGKRCTTGNRK